VNGVVDVRGKGLLLAAVLETDIAADVVAGCMARGLVLNAVRPNAIRWTPPLIIEAAHIDSAAGIFAEALGAVLGKQADGIDNG